MRLANGSKRDDVLVRVVSGRYNERTRIVQTDAKIVRAGNYSVKPGMDYAATATLREVGAR